MHECNVNTKCIAEIVCLFSLVCLLACQLVDFLLALQFQLMSATDSVSVYYNLVLFKGIAYKLLLTDRHFFQSWHPCFSCKVLFLSFSDVICITNAHRHIFISFLFICEKKIKYIRSSLCCR